MADTVTPPHDPALAAKAVALGAEGLGAREIAVALGMTFAALEALEDADAGFAEAMGRAEEAARAWWEGLPRAALSQGKPFHHAGWRAAMAARFEDVAEASGSGAEWVDPRCKDFDEITRASWPVVILPCNGKGKRLPDGSCPFAKQDTSQWPDAWFGTTKPRPCIGPGGEDDWDGSEEDDWDEDEAGADGDEDFAPEAGRSGDEEV